MKPHLALLIILFTLACPTAIPAADPPWIARGTRGMVAADSPHASRVGADVLAAG